MATLPANLERLIAEDEGRDMRQVGLVDAQGRSAAYTGKGCYAWPAIPWTEYTCQGNILVGEATVQAMAHTSNTLLGSWPTGWWQLWLPVRKLAGMSRGKQGAAVLVVKPKVAMPG